MVFEHLFSDDFNFHHHIDTDIITSTITASHRPKITSFLDMPTGSAKGAGEFSFQDKLDAKLDEGALDTDYEAHQELTTKQKARDAESLKLAKDELAKKDEIIDRLREGFIVKKHVNYIKGLKGDSYKENNLVRMEKPIPRQVVAVEPEIPAIVKKKKDSVWDHPIRQVIPSKSLYDAAKSTYDTAYELNDTLQDKLAILRGDCDLNQNSLKGICYTLQEDLKKLRNIEKKCYDEKQELTRQAYKETEGNPGLFRKLKNYHMWCADIEHQLYSTKEMIVDACNGKYVMKIKPTLPGKPGEMDFDEPDTAQAVFARTAKVTAKDDETGKISEELLKLEEDYRTQLDNEIANLKGREAEHVVPLRQLQKDGERRSKELEQKVEDML